MKARRKFTGEYKAKHPLKGVFLVLEMHPLGRGAFERSAKRGRHGPSKGHFLAQGRDKGHVAT